MDNNCTFDKAVRIKETSKTFEWLKPEALVSALNDAETIINIQQQRINELATKVARLEKAKGRMEWVNVKERLPNTAKHVSGFDPVLMINAGHTEWGLFNPKLNIFQNAGYVDVTSQVTHWMPLPKPLTS